ncbi:unnamed protein product [Acanthoscelides obtectus]|uniref:Uncharacterized protein n=1 Tax=Acanthoscelides obtectus TaxID=200917 RepID=A0A9P0K0U1_ACAOB|nr:unnamed protein product [Acanthoscelides obtectus]CAK1669641.1 hypothetical protein AOBTE_LOCUS27122 [Acanthoscelides obtectus]
MKQGGIYSTGYSHIRDVEHQILDSKRKSWLQMWTMRKMLQI